VVLYQLVLEGQQIAEILTFVDARLFPPFGLPPELLTVGYIGAALR
jgi:hypothetical protein